MSVWKNYDVRFYKYSKEKIDVLVLLKKIQATSEDEAENMARCIQAKDVQKKLSVFVDFDFTEAVERL